MQPTLFRQLSLIRWWTMACVVVFGWPQSSQAQPSPSFSRGGVNAYYSFVDYQRSFVRPQEAMARKLDTLQKQFARKQLSWPANYIYIRSFKYDSQLEVWVKQRPSDPFVLFKTYPVCALAGSLGPKRMQGDYQVPEGFYYINEFNPNSNYYLSLGLNYPNASDRILSDSLKPGGDIYIHGSCVTVGCIPITDQQIDELYILAAYAREQGQHYIPVHIFPCRFDVPKSVTYLENLTKDDPALRSFVTPLSDAFFYFERTRKLPVVMITEDGRYHVNDAAVVGKPKDTPMSLSSSLDKNWTAAPKVTAPRKVRPSLQPEETVDQWPRYPGGPEALNRFLDQAGQDLGSYLPSTTTKAFVQVSFIVDRDGAAVNFTIVRGLPGADTLHQKIIERLEQMSTWTPAMLAKKPVPKKLLQTLTIYTK